MCVVCVVCIVLCVLRLLCMLRVCVLQTKTGAIVAHVSGPGEQREGGPRYAHESSLCVFLLADYRGRVELSRVSAVSKL